MRPAEVGLSNARATTALDKFINAVTAFLASIEDDDSWTPNFDKWSEQLKACQEAVAKKEPAKIYIA